MANILIFGATGSVGSEASKALAKRNVAFRAAVHSQSKGEDLKKKLNFNNIELAIVDYSKSETLDAALKGIEKVLLIVPSPILPGVAPNIVSAIKKAGTVKHVVKLSASGSEKDTYIYGREHFADEENLRQTGIPLTTLRPTCFFTNLFMEANSIKQTNIFHAATAEAYINHISTKDIGEAAAIILIEGNKHYNKGYDITGPNRYTGKDVAKNFSEVLGREITFEDVPMPKFKENLLAFAIPAPTVDQFADLFAYYQKGGYDQQSTDLENLTGSKGQTMKEFIEENKAAFL